MSRATSGPPGSPGGSRQQGTPTPGIGQTETGRRAGADRPERPIAIAYQRSTTFFRISPSSPRLF